MSLRDSDSSFCRLIACIDGTLNVWSTTSNFVRPSQSVEGAHVKGTQTGSVVFSVDGRTILTRGGDDTVKRMFFSSVVFLETDLTRLAVWDSRNLRKALHVSPTPLKVLYSETNAIFSPDEKYIVTGCAASSKSTRGKLAFLKREGLEEVKSIDCAEGESVVRVVWHSKINQVRICVCDGDIPLLLVLNIESM